MVRILYAQYWKKPEIPSTPELINKLYKLAEMDLLTDILRGQIRMKVIWSPFYKWLSKRSQE